MNALKQYWFVALLMLTLGGCGALGQVVMPQTPDQKVYAAYGLYMSLINTTSDMLELGTLNHSQGRALEQKFAMIQPELDRLKDIVDGGFQLPTNEIETLQLIQRILIDVQIELQKRSPP